MTCTPTSLDPIVSRNRWTAEEARRVLDALSESGLSVAAFAARYGLQAQRLYLWQRKLSAEVPRNAQSTAFIEISPVPTPVAPGHGRYELVLASGECLRIEGHFDTEAVRTLWTLLRTERTC
jgi:hypothetical protein